MKPLHITEITFRHFGDTGDRIKAVASIVIENQFVVHEVRIIDGPRRGLFAAYPNKAYNQFDTTGCAHPITDITRKAWEQQLLDTYINAESIGAEFTKGHAFHFSPIARGQSPLSMDQLNKVVPEAPMLVYVACLNPETQAPEISSAEWEAFDGRYFYGAGLLDDLQNYGKLFVAFRYKPLRY